MPGDIMDEAHPKAIVEKAQSEFGHLDILVSKAALPIMRPGGAIINPASIEGCQPDANLLAYAATKSANVNFTKGLAAEALQSGIRVNAVTPRRAGGTCPAVCVFSIPGIFLHPRHDLRHHRRRCDWINKQQIQLRTLRANTGGAPMGHSEPVGIGPRACPSATFPHFQVQSAKRQWRCHITRTGRIIR